MVVQSFDITRTTDKIELSNVDLIQIVINCVNKESDLISIYK
jgi:hypothetical protein